METKHKILGLIDSCTGCFACMNICPKDAITLPEKYEGFYYPEIDLNKCIECGLCDKVCPQITEQPTHTMIRAYYGWATDNVIRKASSSGGLFYALAANIIKNGGVVYGASFNYGGIIRLECHSTRTISLKELQKAKYVQNHIGYAFREIKKNLQSGEKVMFCGTPCQAAGLRAFLCKDYENLLLVDFICHGVPSMSLLRLHLEYLGIKDVTGIDFRPKNRGWVDDIVIYFRKKSGCSTNVSCRQTPWRFDEYFNLFENCKSTRRSCRNCHYCNGQRNADITLADFWGIRNYKPEEYDRRGISLILANTAKGAHTIDLLSESINCKINELPMKNAAYVYDRIRTENNSPYQNHARDIFLKDVYEIGYSQALVKHGLKTNRWEYYKYELKNKITSLLK